MYNVVKIGEKGVPMLSMASVDVYYRQIFKEDPIKFLARKDRDEADAINFFNRMAYVMAEFAEKRDGREMAKLNEVTYTEWLCGFERNDLINALPAVQLTYEGQSLTDTTAKKNKDQQTEK